MQKGKLAILGVATVVLAQLSAAPTQAADDSKGTVPAEYQSLLDCRTIADPMARLDCFDKNVAALDAARTRKDVVLSDRESVKQARKSLFGFALPPLRLFGGGNGEKNDVEELKEIDAVIKSAHEGRQGWVFELEDGAVWRQTDGAYLEPHPAPGLKIHIRTGALGSYFAKLGNNPGFRVERVVR